MQLLFALVGVILLTANSCAGEIPTFQSVSYQISESDLGLDRPGGSAEEGIPSIANDQNGILENSFPVVERFDDQSVWRRWTVRLYVTFDRSKPLRLQKPGSWIENGSYEEYYPGGQQRLVQGTFREGKRHGNWTYWHANGKVAKQGAYHDAQLTATWKYYREDGTKLRTEEYQSHQKHGTWRHFDANGVTITREESYNRDQRAQ